MATMSVTIDSGTRCRSHHSLLVINAKRPTQDVLDEVMSPWLADPPWANKEIRLTGYTLGGIYRGWLIPCDGADVIVGPQAEPPPSWYPPTLFHNDGVDAVRVSELRSAERCSSRWYASFKEPRQRKPRFYKAPRCQALVPQVLIPQGCTVTSARETPSDWDSHFAHMRAVGHWWVYDENKDRPCGRWLDINEGSCDDDRIAKIIADTPSNYWLAVVDCWDEWVK